LKYKVQNNVFVVEKLKEVQKTNFLEILCRALCENARQTYIFAVRFSMAHGKGNCRASYPNARQRRRTS
jgi:hypothetical protein